MKTESPKYSLDSGYVTESFTLLSPIPNTVDKIPKNSTGMAAEFAHISTLGIKSKVEGLSSTIYRGTSGFVASKSLLYVVCHSYENNH